MRGKIKKVFRGIGGLLALFVLFSFVVQEFHWHFHSTSQQIESTCQLCKTGTSHYQATPQISLNLPQWQTGSKLPKPLEALTQPFAARLPNPRGPPSVFLT